MICFNDLIRDIQPYVLVDFIVQAVRSMPKKTLQDFIVKLTDYLDSMKGDNADGEHASSNRFIN